MARQTGRSDLPAAPNPASPQDIRNVVLVGPGGAGKTALFEASSRRACHRAAPRSKARAHHQPHRRLVRVERRHAQPPRHPGYPDFVGDLRAACGRPTRRSSSSRGPTTSTARGALWRECAAVGIPRAVAVTHLDSPGPTSTHGRPAGAPSATRRRTPWPGVVEDGAAHRRRRPRHRLDDDLGRTSTQDRRHALIESVIEESEDVTLLDRYLEGEQIETEPLLADLRTAIVQGRSSRSSRSPRRRGGRRGAASS